MNIADIEIVFQKVNAVKILRKKRRVINIENDLRAVHDREVNLRRSIYAVLAASQKECSSSVVLIVCGGFIKDDSQIAAKIAAQEIFRYTQSFKVLCLKKITFVITDDMVRTVFSQTIEKYLEHLTKKICLGPFVTVDGLVEHQGGIIMVERKNPPLGWALPGGFVDRGETVEAAVVREIKEETGLTFYAIKFFKICSDPKRDPRFHTVSVVYIGKGKGRLKARSDAKSLGVFSLDALPKYIAFDHKRIIKAYARSRY